MSEQYLIQGDTLTNLGDKIRTLSGEVNAMTPAEMGSTVDTFNTELGEIVTEQDDLILQIAESLKNKFSQVLPDGYTAVEYLESTGTQYIDTIFKPDNNTRIVMTAEMVSPSSTLTEAWFGARNAANNKEFWGMWYGAHNALCNRYGSNGSDNDDTIFTAVSPTQKNTMVINKNVFSINGVEMIHIEESFISEHNLYLFALNNNGAVQYPAKLRVESCQIYDNDVLVRNYIPCASASGVGYFYDTVNRVFYGNDGTGEFICGEPIAA